MTPSKPEELVQMRYVLRPRQVKDYGNGVVAVMDERFYQYRTRLFRIGSAGCVQLTLGEEWSEWKDVGVGG